MPKYPSEYYHSLITQQSWEELLRLKQLLEFVLIGGWATYLHAHALKSKDIDIVINYDQLAILSQHYQLVKNERLHKYEAIKGEVQIDIYLPHMAQIGIPVEDILKHVASIEGFSVIDINLLFTSKLYTFSQRGRTPKGRKDFLDLLSLFLSGHCDPNLILQYTKEYKLEDSSNFFKQMLTEVTQVTELGLNSHKLKKFKREIEAIFSKT